MTRSLPRTAIIVFVVLVVPLLLAVNGYRFTFDNPSVGGARAPFTLEYFSTTTCEGCRLFETVDLPQLEPLISGGELRLVFRDLPTAPPFEELSRNIFCLQTFEDFAALRRSAKANRDFDWDDLPVLHGRARAQHEQCVTDTAAAAIHQHNQSDFERRGFGATPAFTLVYAATGKAASTQWVGRPDTTALLHAMETLRSRVTEADNPRRDR